MVSQKIESFKKALLKLSQEDGLSPLHLACQIGNIGALKVFLAIDPSSARKDSDILFGLKLDSK